MTNESDQAQDPYRLELEQRAHRYAEVFRNVDEDSVELCLALLRTSTILSRSIGRTIAAFNFNMNPPRLLVLRALYLSDAQRLSFNEIAGQMGVNPTNLTTIIDVLVRDGWVERATNEEDRRVVYVQLTEDGKARCEVILPAMLQFMGSFASGLSAKRTAAMLESLSLLRRRADELSRNEE
jgi:MarR family 2-MHQ and catechol resistance regulon transcriptional repressor